VTTHSSGDFVTEDLDALFEEMVSQQRAKVLALARSLRPRLTDDDILSPLDIPELADDGRFNYEDGLLAGRISARIAVRAHFRRKQG
jgi:hypothetical protein